MHRLSSAAGAKAWLERPGIVPYLIYASVDLVRFRHKSFDPLYSLFTSLTI